MNRNVDNSPHSKKTFDAILGYLHMTEEIFKISNWTKL